MTPIRVVIADDEPVARQRLRRLVGARRDCRLVGEFCDGAALEAGLPGLEADLVLLDIDMPGPNGFAALARLADPKPLIVFVTAYAEFAPQAFDVDAVDYLLKPVSDARLAEALGRTARRLRASKPVDAGPAPSMVRFVAQGRVHLFDPSQISTLRACGNYVEITAGTRQIQLRTTLGAACERLDDQRFVRVHRSWVVAREAMAQVTSLPGSRCEILLKDGRRVPGGRAFAHAVSGPARSLR